jgi:predicted ATP-dependent endonuclease of OLD family
MYVFAVHIKNFRLFEDIWCFPNRTLNCIIGPNNSGKSTLIEALSIVLDPKAPVYRDDFITQFDYYNCNTVNPITIDVWLDKHETENDEIKIRAFDKFSRWKLKKYQDSHPEKLEPVIAEPLEDTQTASSENILELLRVQFKATWEEQTKSAEYQTVILNEIDEQIEQFSIALRKLIGFNTISSNKEPLRDISLSKKGIFAQFLDDDVINPHIRNLIEVLENNKSSLLDSLGIKQVVDRLKKVVAAQVVGNTSGQNDDAISITFLNSDIGKLRSESCFSIKIGNRHGNGSEPSQSIHVPLEYQGNGIQNLFLIITLAEIIKQQAGTNHCIVMLEEPEQHLEPSQVKWVYSELCKCFGSDSGGANQNQLFITSHSPALVGEIKGADRLILMPVEKMSGILPKIVNAKNLSDEIKKSFERNRDLFTSALLAKYILIVEGASELGFLPVAFRHLSKDAYDNPFHLGLEIVNGENNEQAFKYATELLPFNRFVHVLIDYDRPKEKCNKTTEQLMAEYNAKEFFVTCWPKSDLLTFTKGCDLEIVLTNEVHPDILLEAIKEAYKTPCHEFNEDKWKRECDKLKDDTLKDKLKKLFPHDEAELNFADTLSNITEKQVYLFLLLHAPHSCKSVKEMRIIAEYLASKNAFPDFVKLLYKRILSWIKTKSTIPKQEYLVRPTNGN